MQREVLCLPPLCYGPDLETQSRTHASLALGETESTAESLPQPTSKETRALGPQNPFCVPCGHLWRRHSSKPSPTSLFGVHSRFRMAPGPRSPTVSHLTGAFWCQPRWTPSSMPAALVPVSAAVGASRPPSSCLLTQPAGMGRDWSPGLGGHPTSVCLTSARGDLGLSLLSGLTQGLGSGAPVKKLNTRMNVEGQKEETMGFSNRKVYRGWREEHPHAC